MRRTMISAAVFTAVLFWAISPVSAADVTLIPGGSAVGLQLDTDGVIVAEKTASCRADLCGGDRILAVNDAPVTSAAQVQAQVEAATEQVVLQLERSGKSVQLLAPLNDDGKLGVLVKDQLAGVGTVTYVDPHTGDFGCLGHGVTETGSDALLPVRGGSVLPSQVVSVERGKTGTPGKLNGAALSLAPIGRVEKNTDQGVFGVLDQWDKTEPVSVGTAEEVCTGPAVIRSCVSGAAVQEYDVEILEIYPTQTETGRNLLLRVTDRELLKQTGGIVQGMSGSPIIQDGKLVGAVTHVLVNDPTRGYGIFIENMLDAASESLPCAKGGGTAEP